MPIKPVSQIGSVLSQLFRFRPLAQLRKAASRRRAIGERSQADFLDQLKDILGRNAGAVQAGRVNLIGLERLRDRLGERWTASRERVHALARSALGKYLGPEDIWVAVGDSYVIAFGRMDVEDAQTKCRMIGRMIEEALLGEDDSSDGIEVATAVATIDRKILFRELPPLEAMLVNLPSFSASWPQRELRRDQPQLAGTSASAFAQIGRRVGKHEHLELVSIDGDEPGGTLVWEPLWDIRHERVPIYRAKYIASPGEGAANHAIDEAKIAREDTALREMLLGELARSAAASRLIALGLPARFWTLASYTRRRAYVAALAASTSPEMRRFLVLFLSEVPTGVPAGRLIELIAALRPFCRELVVETDLHAPNLTALTGSKVFAVGADLSSVNEPERLLMLHMDQFARHAAKAGIGNCYLGGVKNMSATIAAIGAGYRYISGPIVGSLGPDVSNVRPLTLEHLYRRNFEARGLSWPEYAAGEMRLSA